MDYYLENPHPGPILEEEFFQPYGVSHEEFAEATQMAVEDIDKLVNACCSVTADMDVRLTRFWGMLEGVLRLQHNYDMMEARKKAERQNVQVDCFSSNAQERGVARKSKIRGLSKNKAKPQENKFPLPSPDRAVA